jgi:hypothetical protein
LAGQPEHCRDQVEDAVHGYSHETKGKQDDPDERISDQRDDCEWPAEYEEDAEKEESEHWIGVAPLSNAVTERIYG